MTSKAPPVQAVRGLSLLIEGESHDTLTKACNKAYALMGVQIVNPKRFWGFYVACATLSGIHTYHQLKKIYR